MNSAEATGGQEGSRLLRGWVEAAKVPNQDPTPGLP